jgi:hypothetical protein
MFIVRDIFQLKFGHYKDAKALMDEAKAKNMFPKSSSVRILTDFTGNSYRLILESGYDTLANYEKELTGGMANNDWKDWYEKFKQQTESSHREILKVVM